MKEAPDFLAPWREFLVTLQRRLLGLAGLVLVAGLIGLALASPLGAQPLKGAPGLAVLLAPVGNIPAWTQGGSTLGEKFSQAFAVTDINGDGYADLIVGAPGFSSGDGKVYVYLGSSSGLPTSPSLVINQYHGGFFGSAIAACDVNGDGYGDAIIGEPQYGSSQGRAYIYWGSAAGLNTLTPLVLPDSSWPAEEFGSAVACTGDVNGDGNGDFIVGAPGFGGSNGRVYFYQGGPTVGAAPTSAINARVSGSRLGAAVAGVGDVDGDGFADILLGAPGANQAYLYRGSASGPDANSVVTLAGLAGENFGQRLGAAGDVNGDGYADVLVGAPAAASGQGCVYLYLGRSSGLNPSPDQTLPGATASNFGQSLGTVGDVNGDGYADVLIGADGANTNIGQAYLYLGSHTGLAATPVITLAGAASSDYFGFSTGAGDMNGDGYADLLVGAYGRNTNSGALAVYSGGAYLPQAAPSTTLTGVTSSHFGQALASAGDVNGDGYADLLVGAPNANQVSLYRGSAASLTPATTLTGPAPATQFGGALAGAGDVNGDGYADVLVGAPGANQAYLYPGSAAGLSASPILTLVGPTPATQFGGALAGVGDVNGDGYADVLVGAPGANRTYLYLGSAAGLSASPAFTLTGSNPAGAGDVNGDGYADVLVGASSANQVYVYLGGLAGLSATPALTLAGSIPATAGDVNGDGYADVLVGAPSANQTYLYLGGANGLSSTPSLTLTGPAPATLFGAAVGTAGDVNGDGYADVWVGAPGANQVYLYLGSAAGLGTSPALTLTAPSPSSSFGAAGAAADLNGDGYADVLIGAYGYNGQQGQAYVYLGNQGGGLAALPAALRVDGSQLIPPWGLSPVTDGFQVRLTAHTPLGRGRARLQTQVCPAGAAFASAACRLQTSPAWTDVPASGAGVAVSQLIAGLAPNTLYHWRTRLVYAPYGASTGAFSAALHGPWRRPDAQAREADLRTGYADVRLAQTVAPAMAKPGDPLTYTLAFSNAGNGLANGILITDVLPVSVTNISLATAGADVTAVNSSYVWSIASLAPGQSGFITITGALVTPLPVGVFTNTAQISSLSPDADSSNNRSSVAVRVAKSDTAVRLEAAPNPSGTGWRVTFTATVTSHGGVPTGPLTFTVDGAAAPSLLVGGVATYTTSSLSLGSHQATALYGGDANFSASTSPTLTQVTTNFSTVTALIAHTPNPSYVGEAVVVSFTVTALGGTPTGQVTVTAFGLGSCTGTLTAGSGACRLTLSRAGTWQLTAAYAGDGTYKSSSLPRSVSHTIVDKLPTSTLILDQAPNPSTPNQPVTVTFSVTGTPGTLSAPTGQVTVTRSGGGGIEACTGTVAEGQCTLTFLTPGNSPLVAVYAGDTAFDPSTSAPAEHIVTIPENNDYLVYLTLISE